MQNNTPRMRPMSGTLASITLLGIMMTTFLFALLNKSILEIEAKRSKTLTQASELFIRLHTIRLWNPLMSNDNEHTLKLPHNFPGEVINQTFIKPHSSIFPPEANVTSLTSVKYLIRQDRTCKQFARLAYVVVVRSDPNNILRRQNLRQTWASQTLFPGVNARTIFLLGRTSDSLTQETINTENRVYKDIVQFDFKDISANMTLKTVLGLRWIAENCRNADFVIHVEDTAFVNIFQVLDQYTPVLSANPKQLICSVETNGTIFRSSKHDRSNSKWMIPESYFPGLSVYPMPFCYRFAVFMSVSLTVELYNTATATPFFPLDDVYVYGILASKISGLTWRNVKEKYLEENTLIELLNSKQRNHGSVVGVSGVFNSQDVWRQLKGLWV